MLKFDFETYMEKYINKKEFSTLLKEKNKFVNKLKSSNMSGWFNRKIDSHDITQIKEISEEIRNDNSILVVVAIGGSYMGSYSLIEMFKEYQSEDKVVYIGNNLSSKELTQKLKYIEDKNVYLNIISKSGNTLEVKLVYKIVKEYLQQKYSKKELEKRIIITTSRNSILRDEAINNNYRILDFPDDIGGRYSLITCSHLLPLSVFGLDINELMTGYYEGIKYLDDAYYYACLRRYLFDKNKLIENFSVYEPSMYYFTEFLKQLFAESEGKNKKGIFPVSTVNTRDLHSLGQFLQNGKDIIFETVIRINNQDECELDRLNKIVSSAVSKVHYSENTPSNIINLDSLSVYSIGEVVMFFMMSSAFSGYLFGVNPFNQPGVEKYKEEIYKILDKK